MVIPFVSVYTRGITDADYIVPLFAGLITLAHAVHCLRLPYNILILAAGHYKQTQNSYIISAVMNIVISILTVKLWGLVGVAIGTLCAMLYQTIWMVYYDSKNIRINKTTSFWKHVFVDLLVSIIAISLSLLMPYKSNSYVTWIILAIIVTIIWGGVEIIVNLLFYKNEMLELKDLIAKRISRGKNE